MSSQDPIDNLVKSLLEQLHLGGIKMLMKILNWLKEMLKKNQPSQESPKEKEPLKSKPKMAEKLLYYPKASIPKKGMNGSGNYEHGYPQGAVVHFTAGRDEKITDAMDSYEWGRGEGYVFFVIGIDGTVIQGFPLNVRGAHAGTSSWPGLGDGVSKHLVGIEICCAGNLEKVSTGKYVSGFKKYYTEDQVRYVTEEEYGCPTGYYKKFTPEQEASLIELLKWLRNNNPDVFKTEYILAHHEVAGKKGIGYFRKPDCGGSLSMTMSQLRKLIEDETAQ